MYLQEAYEDYHAEDPGQRVPPIPTVKLSASGTPKEHSLLCYTNHKYTATESHIDAIMKTIYLALVNLDAMIPSDSDIRAVQVHALKCAWFYSGTCFGNYHSYVFLSSCISPMGSPREPPMSIRYAQQLQGTSWLP